MSSDFSPDLAYLDFILDAIDRIEDYTRDGRARLFGDRMVQDAVLRNLQTLSEATSRLSESARSQHPEIPWRVIAGFRNVLTHDYLGINLDLVWPVVEEQLPNLKRAILAIRSKLD